MAKVNQNFSEEMARRGFKNEGVNFYGVHKNRPYLIQHMGNAGTGNNFFLTVSLDRGVDNKIIKSITKNLKANSPKTVKFYPTIAVLGGIKFHVLCKKRDTLTTDIEFLFNGIDNELMAVAAGTPAICSVCKTPNVDSYAWHGELYTTVHNHCITGEVEKTVSKAKDNELVGNYPLGIIGALIGGVVGIIPSVIVAVFFHIISAWLCALIPLCAYYGYKLLKGKMNAFATVTTIIVSVIMVPIMDFVNEFFMAYIEYDGQYLITVSDYINVFMAEPELFLPSYLQSLLFVVLGVVVVAGIISQGNKSMYKSAGAMAESVRPIEGVMPAVPQAAPQATAVAGAEGYSEKQYSDMNL